ncbi:Hint domain-containing protein [Tateyamaria sp. Alg231-49]|uniref:Hint domain-containing protein n=1 Tax=Tateyamaria sp. Alg231-49 TaxID=1922219 RepID=UPI000D555DF7|nr:Hint domain-containing protein [Tateyamaria sp. Alg231-49]
MADPFLSEIKYLGGANLDFIEVAVDVGYDVSDLVLTIYNSNGSIRSSSNLSVLTPTTVNGKDVYLIENGDATNFNGVALSNAVALSENGTVYSFVSFNDTVGGVTATEGPASGTTSDEIGIAGAGSSLETDDGGTSYFTQTNPNPGSVPCLTTGAKIQTSHGLVKVEDLKSGAHVYTFDGVHKPLRKIFKRAISKDELNQNPRLYPVRICAGALGPGLPSEDLLVSRQHRMVVSSPIAKRMFGSADVLVAANKLTSQKGIFVDTSVSSIEYFHLLFDAHEIIFADGAPTESLFLGAEAMNTLPTKILNEIRRIFPGIKLPLEDASSKLYIPTNRRQTKLVERHLKNQTRLVTAL